MEPLYIGLSGVAGSGKDTFFSYLEKILNNKKIKRYSFGDQLKKEVSPWTLEHYGVDSLTKDREDKEIIRPFLIFHASAKRQKTKGKYWIEKTEEEIEKTLQLGKEFYPEIICITDVRYNFYECDEVSWIKRKGGIIVYISRVFEDGSILEAKNSEEQKHDPLVRRVADYTVEISEKNNEEDIEKEMTDKTNVFLQWLKTKKWKM